MDCGALLGVLGVRALNMETIILGASPSNGPYSVRSEFSQSSNMNSERQIEKMKKNCQP